MKTDRRVIKFPDHYAVHEVTYNEAGIPIAFDPTPLTLLNPDFVHFIEQVHAADANFPKVVLSIEDFPNG